MELSRNSIVIILSFWKSNDWQGASSER